jgi:hypothetical protein
MAQAQLIDRYLVTLQRSLGKAPDADDILAEVEDHLREATAAYRRDGLDAHDAETRTLQTFGSPKLVARAFADARKKKGIAMPTTFTRRAGPAAIVCPLALVAGMLLLDPERWTARHWTTNWYFAANSTILIALALLIAAMLGLRARHGGALGSVGLAGLVLTAVGALPVLLQVSWALPFWLIPISVGCALFALGLLRARLLSRLAATLFGGGLLLTAALALRDALVGDEQNVTVWPYGFLGIAIFGLGLTWLGWQLRAERPVQSGHGMAPAA